MVSVLIPAYNINPQKLVRDLLESFRRAETEGEIIVSDVSDTPNAQLLSLSTSEPQIRYFHHQELLSRSANRNFLGSKARFTYLIFMDADAELIDIGFIANYLSQAKDNSVLCGGTAYSDIRPDSPELTLRWKYGKAREEIPAKIRQSNPHKSFSSFNFLIPSAVFHKIRFNESFKNYGHEDTYFGYQLKGLGIPVVHIDNPLIHTGLDSFHVFLKKTEQGIAGLVEIAADKSLSGDFLQTIKLWRTYNTLKQFGLHRPFIWLYPALKKGLLLFLKGRRPSIVMFDVYKIAYLIKIKA